VEDRRHSAYDNEVHLPVDEGAKQPPWIELSPLEC
jgi:hypothetical protein